MTKREMAPAYAALLGTVIARPNRYPPAELLLVEELAGRFLGSAQAMPVAIEGNLLVEALADPFDQFMQAAIAAATCIAVVPEIGSRSTSRRRSTGFAATIHARTTRLAHRMRLSEDEFRDGLSNACGQINPEIVK